MEKREIINYIRSITELKQSTSLINEVTYDIDHTGSEINIDVEVHGSTGTYVPLVINPRIKYSDTPDNIWLDEDTKVQDYWNIFNIGWCSGAYVQLESKYYMKLRELYSDFDSIKSSGNEKDINNRKQSILDLGWNPELPFNENTIIFARNKLQNLAYQQIIHIVDCTLNEEENSELFSESNKYCLSPIFIILSYTGTLFGKLIKTTTKAEFSHAAIGIDPNLKEIYSFNGDNSKNIFGGFSIESIENYKIYNPDGNLYIAAVFITLDQMKKVKDMINYYIENINRTKYSFIDILRILINKEITSERSLSMICSQFVNSILRIADVNIVNKPDNLVMPQDFKNARNNYIYIVYNGLLKDYSNSIIKKNINKIKPVKYNSNPIVLSEAVLYEVDAPIQMDAEGNLIIKTALNLEKEYQDAHRLLKIYDENNNIEGMKFEVARLYYLTHRADDMLRSRIIRNKKSIQDTRARIINDYDKYLDIIIKAEPDFNATVYYKTTPYYEYEVKISKYTIDYLIKYTKDITNI